MKNVDQKLNSYCNTAPQTQIPEEVVSIGKNDILVNNHDSEWGTWIEFYLIVKTSRSGKTLYVKKLQNIVLKTEEKHIRSSVYNIIKRVIPGKEAKEEIIKLRINEIFSDGLIRTHFPDKYGHSYLRSYDDNKDYFEEEAIWKQD